VSPCGVSILSSRPKRKPNAYSGLNLSVRPRQKWSTNSGRVQWPVSVSRSVERVSGLKIIRFIALALCLPFVPTPLYWMVITSVKPTSDYLTVPPVWLPKEPTLIHFTAALSSYRGLRDGKIEQQGAPLDLFEQPAALFVADFLGSSKMSFLKGQLARTEKICIHLDDRRQTTAWQGQPIERWNSDHFGLAS
jgi:hypothetical protein